MGGLRFVVLHVVPAAVLMLSAVSMEMVNAEPSNPRVIEA